MINIVICNNTIYTYTVFCFLNFFSVQYIYMYDHIMCISKEPHYDRTSNGVLYMGVQISTANYIMEEEDVLSCKAVDLPQQH